MNDKKIDQTDRRILSKLQIDSAQSQRDLAESVGLSQNALWRRLKNLQKSGVINGHAALLDRQKLGLGLVVFVMLRTRHHSADWLRQFRSHVTTIPEVIDFFPNWRGLRLHVESRDRRYGQL